MTPCLKQTCLVLCVAWPICAASGSTSAIYQALGSPDTPWSVVLANGTSMVLPAYVPGSIHLDLLAAGRITDPNFGWNEVEQRWIAGTDWSYEATINVSESLAAAASVDLVLPGVDTAANVTLNGIRVGSVSNMHRTYRLAVKPALFLQSPAILRFDFTNPVSFSAAALASCRAGGGPYCPDPWSGPAPNPIVNNAYIRKEQDSFSWDFAPATGTTGVWKEPLLVGYSGAVLDGVVVDTAPATATDAAAWIAHLRIRLFCSAAPPGNALPGNLSATIFGAGPGAAAWVPVATLSAGYSVVLLDVPVAAPELWWPNGYGSQPLYNCTVTFTTALGEADSRMLRVGFRTVALEQPAVPGGNLFRFVVNGRPILARGSNWSPPDSLQGRVTPERIRWLLSTTADAGYNTLRVWGGGVYASDAMLDCMDELGVLVYHDAQFGDQFYSTDAGFLASVGAEAQDNAWRMGSHASFALWCGNNEMASGYDEHGFYSATAYYADLYFSTVLGNVSFADPARSIVSSTPSWGNETAAWPFHPNESSTVRGDMHYYSDADCWDVTTYPRARFVTEHGVESWPSLLTLAPTLTGPADFSFNASLPVSRQHHPPGQAEITAVVESHWLWPGANGSARLHGWQARYNRLAGDAARLAAAHRASLSSGEAASPASTVPVDALRQVAWLGKMNAGVGAGDNASTYRDVLWMTQVAQAQCLTVAAEYWRGISDEYNETLPGGTAGILFWQADDIWPAPSWAALEYGGRPKVLYYASKRFFADTLVTGYIDAASGGRFVVYVSNMAGAANAPPLEGASVVVSAWSWSSGLLSNWTVDVPIIAPHSSGRVCAVPLSDVMRGCASPADCVLTLDLMGPPPERAQRAHNWAYIAPLRNVTSMRDPGLRVVRVAAVDSHFRGGYDAFTVTLTAETLPAAVVWLETALPGRFSDNGFLLTQLSVDVQWVSAQPGVTAAQLAASLIVQSLWDAAPYDSGSGAATAESI